MATRSSVRAARREARLVSAFRCQRVRLNSLWSIWYCVIVLALEIYLTASSIQQFVRYISLQWPDDSQPFTELNAYVGFVGVAVVLLPFFVVAAIFRVGNLANDGFKLGGASSAHDLRAASASQRTPWRAVRTVWRHCGPTAPFLHIISAFCLLFPKVLIQAKLIKHGFLHKDDIWRTDLDFMVTHKDRIVVLSILASGNHSTGTVSPQQDDLAAGLGHRRGGSDDPGRTFDDLAPISPEFINYAIALLVYSVRYPAVFWETNKPFSFLFSLQLVFGSLQSLLAFTGFAVLYKLNAYGLELVLPSTGDGFLLGRPLAVVLYSASSAIVGLSGSVVYFYGWRKFQLGLVREREKHHISWRESSRTLWGYLPHCLAFAVLVAVACVTCPLMYDYTVIYKGSLDGAVLSCVVGTIMYFFLWIVLWFALTLKQRWHFRLHAGAATVCNGKIAKLPNDFELQKQKPAKNAPLIVISNGQTYTVRDLTPKKAIMSVIHKSIQYQQQQHQRCKANVVDDDDIYWLKPKPPSPKPSPEAERLLWTGRKKSSPSVKHKVTFEDTLTSGSPRKARAGGSNKSPKTTTKFKKQTVKFEDLSDTDDDGDYATLRDIPLIQEVDEEHETTLEELLQSASEEVNDEMDKGDVDHQTDEEIRSPSIERDYPDAERMCLLAKSPVHKINVAVTVHDESPSPQASTAVTSFLLKAVDEEHPEVATTRSNSLSSSCSPPEKGGGSSDTSSGIHSSSSICDNNSTSARKSSSMDDLSSGVDDTCPKPGHCWKSLSLQRTPGTFVPVRGMMTVVPNVGLDYVGAPHATERQRESMMVLLRKQKRPKTADLTSQSQEPFERDTNMKLTSFTDQSSCFAPGAGSRGSSPASSSKTIAKQKIAPLTIGILTSSPRHLPCTQDLNLVTGASKFPGRQRDSANYSLTSSGDSDNYLSHP